MLYLLIIDLPYSPLIDILYSSLIGILRYIIFPTYRYVTKKHIEGLVYYRRYSTLIGILKTTSTDVLQKIVTDILWIIIMEIS